MTKIHIIGGPGSGKTYLGKNVSSLLNIPHLNLDRIFWNENAKRFGVKNSKEKRKELLCNFLENKDYVIEGVYDNWLNDSFLKADIIIILNNHLFTRDVRIIKRFFLDKWNKTEQKKQHLFDLLRMLKWNRTFQKENLPRILLLKNTYPDKTFIFTKADTALEFILSNTKKEE